MAAEHFALAIMRLPQMTDGKKRLVAVGRALNAKQLPTQEQRTYAWLAWRVFVRLLVGYGDELARLEQLYNVKETDFRDEIAKQVAKLWDEKRWRRR